MSIKISLYDLFSHTIPGGLYIATITYFLYITGFISIDFNIINTFSSWLLIVAITMAYILGSLLDPIASRIARVFSITPRRKSVFADFQKRHPHINLHFRGSDSNIMRLYVKQANVELGDNIERAGANQSMFRNLGLNFLILSIVLIIHFAISWHTILIPAAICSLALSFLGFAEHEKWRRWFHEVTYQSIIAIALKDQPLATYKQEDQLQTPEKKLLETLINEQTEKTK